MKDCLMSLKIRKNKFSIFITLLLILALLTGLTAGYFSTHGITENGKFEAFSGKVFQNEVSGSTLTLHYTLAHPEKQGIRRKKASLGTVPTDMKNTYQICSQYEKKLKSFRYSRLSTENQLTLDSMLLYYHTEKSLGDNYLLQEPLGPSLGIQAQLPVLLAEYAFYEDRDITDYLNLLTTIRPYFQSILKFEKKKSEAGFFMSDTTLDRVLAQCSAFIQNPDNNYMLEIFQKKLSEYGKLPSSEQNALVLTHQNLMKTEVIPAYQELMTGLEALRGTGKNTRGLTYFKGGKGDICERWEVCLDLLLQGIQHLGRLYFSESDSPAESSQKLRVLSHPTYGYRNPQCDLHKSGCRLPGPGAFYHTGT